jgi:hypothetical protein
MDASMSPPLSGAAASAMTTAGHGKFLQVFSLDEAFQYFFCFSGNKSYYLNIMRLQHPDRSLTESSAYQYIDIQFFKKSEAPIKHSRLKQL